MSRRFFGGSGSARYQRLSKSDDGFVDMQFEKPPSKIPYKAIALATALFAVGTLLISIGALLLTGHISSEYADRTWPLLILGALMFIPGSYHVMIAYYAYKGYEGYSFEDIPDFD
ncbi:transmembrane protein 230 isoform X1 [Octopus sinensis]|uniref:Transmembrane protein 230 n=1 Tax=Octopus sinensis TaxID=2607531 RepID=A0A6P7T298_9MOLL|nr:transmembrane protein 230 isoform X1 [Octopus sinensis]XP_036364848.1 transmembrane protein 230 isoform X1 [Octopus sinensis]